MRAALIENGIVKNIILVDSLSFLPNLVDDSEGLAQIGGGWDGQSFSPAPTDKNAFNAPILAQLEVIDAKSIRPLREGDIARVAALEAQAAALRLQLMK